MALSRLTTIGTGGPARLLARPETIAELRSSSGGPRRRPSRSRRSGSARTCSSHDDGVDALVLRLAGELAQVRVEGTTSSRAEARRTPSASTGRATPGSAGSSSRPRSPGTAGGGVRMNAGAYGSDWRGVARRRVVVDGDGARTRDGRRARAGLPAFEPARRRSRRGGELCSSSRGPGEIKATRHRAARPAEGDPADEQADVRERLQEPSAEAGAGR